MKTVSLALAVVSGVVVVLVAGAFLWLQQHRDAERRSEIAHVKAEYSRLLTVHDSVDSELTRWRMAEGDYQKYEATANSVSQDRHDKAIAGGYGEQTILELADREHNALHSMITTANLEFDAMDGIADAYASIYGDDAVRSLRNDVSTARSSRDLEFNDWDRAISDIRDSIQSRINGVFGTSSSNIENFYQESENEGVEADRRVEIVNLDVRRLGHRYESDAGSLKNAEAKLR